MKGTTLAGGAFLFIQKVIYYIIVLTMSERESS